MAIYEIGTSRFDSLDGARTAARSLITVDPKEPVKILESINAWVSDLREIWVGPVTFLAVNSRRFIAYSNADLDSIGAVEHDGDKYVASSRGALLGEFPTLFDAAEALHKFAKSPAYRSA